MKISNIEIHKRHIGKGMAEEEIRKREEESAAREMDAGREAVKALVASAAGAAEESKASKAAAGTHVKKAQEAAEIAAASASAGDIREGCAEV